MKTGKFQFNWILVLFSLGVLLRRAPIFFYYFWFFVVAQNSYWFYYVVIYVLLIVSQSLIIKFYRRCWNEFHFLFNIAFVLQSPATWMMKNSSEVKIKLQIKIKERKQCSRSNLETVIFIVKLDSTRFVYKYISIVCLKLIVEIASM